MGMTNVIQKRGPNRSCKAKCKSKKAVHQPFDHIATAYAYALWVGDPADVYLEREERVQGWVIVSHTTPTRIIADISNDFGESHYQTWYRNGRPIGGSGNCLLRVATIPEIVEWEIARPEERRVRRAEAQKRMVEKEALQSLVPQGIPIDEYSGLYYISGLTREQAEVAGAALKAIVR